MKSEHMQPEASLAGGGQAPSPNPAGQLESRRGPDRVRAGTRQMPDIATRPRTKVRRKTQRPRLYKVILINDDYTPRQFVVTVLKAVFRMSEDQAYRVMMTAHKRGVCVVAVFTKDVAETKATEGTELGRSAGYPLAFTTQPEE
jgi:ATP-dependent Clp protease adaptor protein ClpS